MSQSTPYRPRPKSALPVYSMHLRQHRLDDNQSLNSIRNQIHHVFSHENKSMKEVKDLTSRLSPASMRRIDRMCVQYSICSDPKRQKRLSEDVDVQFIAKRYVRERSKQKKKEEQRQELRRSIGVTSKRYDPVQVDHFFKFDHTSLRNMEQKALKGNNNRPLKAHPFMQLYQSSQNEALIHLTDGNSIAPKELIEHPHLVQPDEWQRQRKQIKLIYTGLKQLRSNTMRQRQRKRGRDEQQSFYIT